MAGMYGCFKSRNSDNAAMASGPPDVMASQESAEVAEECSGKKKSKFQTFKKFFARKKRKQPPATGGDARLKSSQSSDDVGKASENNTLTRSEKDKGSGSKISLGSKALSHDSVFVSDSSEVNEALGASQDSIHGKVKSLQLQLKQAMRLGSPPSLICVKRTEDAGTMSEDDGLPCSPTEYTPLHSVMTQGRRDSSISLGGIDSEDDQLSCAASSRAVSPLVVPGDFSQPASPFGCLDNSAAKHKLGLRNKACNKRKPISRVEMREEVDSVVEKRLDISITEALEEQQTITVDVVELKPEVDGEEEDTEEKEEEEERQQIQHSRKSLLRDNDERGDGESDAEQDVSNDQDVCSPSETYLSEEEAPDVQPPPSFKPSSRASALDSARATPEPPAGVQEYLPDPPVITDGAEENMAGGDREVLDNREEEGSLLQEVLSSLKTPLVSSSLCTDSEDCTQEEVREQEREDMAVEEDEEVETKEPVTYQAAQAGVLLSDHTTEEEEHIDTVSTSTPEEEEKIEDEEEEEEDKEEDDEEEEEEEEEGAEEGAEEEEEEEEEELVVERFIQNDEIEEGEKEEAEEPEEQNNILTGNTDSQAEQERRSEENSDGEEEEEEEEEKEAMEVEREPEVDEEGHEKWEEVEVNEGVEEAEAVGEEVMASLSAAADKDDKIIMVLQEEEEGADDVAEDDPEHAGEEKIPTVLGNLVPPVALESQMDSNQSFAEEREEEGEEVEGEAEIDHMEDEEEDSVADQPGADQTEQEGVQESVQISHLEGQQVEKDQADITSQPPPLALPESPYETPPQDGEAISPSKTRTTSLHINLHSPSSDTVPSFFQQSPSVRHRQERETPCCDLPSTEQSTAEEAADPVEPVEADNQSAPEDETAPTASVEERVSQLSDPPDQSKVRFTIAPARQRSLSVEDISESLPPDSSPAAYSSSSSATQPGGCEVEATTKKDLEVKAEPVSSAKVDLVMVPGRVRNAGATSYKPQSGATSLPPPFKPKASAAAGTDESSGVLEGNPDNRFGVRLRKTSVLSRFSTEEENPEPHTEPPAQASSCKVDSLQPVTVKPSVSQPVSNKPALPKKPDVHGDTAGKSKRISDSAAARGVSAASHSPSWISVAKQKQKMFKENSVEETHVKKEDQERKSSLPMYVSSAASKENVNQTAESTSKVGLLDINKPSLSVEDSRRALSPPTPVPSQPPKTQSPPCPIPPKPHIPPVTAKHPPQRSLSPPTPVPVAKKFPSYTNPPTLSKSPQAVTSPPFSSRTSPEKSGARLSGLSGQTPTSQRGPPPPALAQDEPPWMALAKKKAKAWSEMPQIVQ